MINKIAVLVQWNLFEASLRSAFLNLVFLWLLCTLLYYFSELNNTDYFLCTGNYLSCRFYICYRLPRSAVFEVANVDLVKTHNFRSKSKAKMIFFLFRIHCHSLLQKKKCLTEPTEDSQIFCFS